MTTRGVPDAALDVDGAKTENPARSNIAAVPVYTEAEEIREPPVWTGYASSVPAPCSRA